MTKPENKTTEPRTDKTEQAPPKHAAMPQIPIPGYDQWAAAARENLTRLQQTVNAYWDELAGYENALYDRARQASADLANLTSESIAYVAALSAEWRRMSVEATRRFADSFAARS